MFDQYYFLCSIMIVNMVDFTGVRRVSIIGPSGSGKSFLAKELGRLFNLPVYHIDLHFWQRGWQKPPDKDAWLLEIENETKKESWIIDGTYLDTLENRFNRSDLVIYLNLETEICIESAIKRHLLKRDDFPAYLQNRSPEDLDRLLDIINNWYAKNEKEVESLLESYAKDKHLRFCTRKEVDDFIESIESSLRTK